MLAGLSIGYQHHTFKGGQLIARQRGRRGLGHIEEEGVVGRRRRVSAIVCVGFNLLGD